MSGEAPNYLTLQPGMRDDELGKDVGSIVIQASQYIVYIATDCSIQWHIHDTIPTPHLGEISNLVSLLEVNSAFLLPRGWRPRPPTNLLNALLQRSPPESIEALTKIRTLGGEALARIFDGNDVDQARRVLDQANKLLEPLNIEYSRRWYYEHALKLAILAILIAILMWIGRASIIPVIGRKAFTVSVASLFGSLGAYVSVAHRGKKIALNATYGAATHKSESNARVATGVISAAAAILAVQSGILFGDLSRARTLPFLILLAVLSGYSERLIPNMVRKIEPSTPPDMECKRDRKLNAETTEIIPSQERHSADGSE